MIRTYDLCDTGAVVLPLGLNKLTELGHCVDLLYSTRKKKDERVNIPKSYIRTAE